MAWDENLHLRRRFLRHLECNWKDRNRSYLIIYVWLVGQWKKYRRDIKNEKNLNVDCVFLGSVSSSWLGISEVLTYLTRNESLYTCFKKMSCQPPRAANQNSSYQRKETANSILYAGIALFLSINMIIMSCETRFDLRNDIPIPPGTRQSFMYIFDKYYL